MVAAMHGTDSQEHRGPQPPTRISIGSVGAISMAAGLTVAVALVAVPFVPARQNVLTGVVLLGFALGWALLAVLSVRLTDQPQRWTAAPAGFTTVASLSALGGFAGVQAVLSWVWPPALLGLGVLDVPAGPRSAAQSKRTMAAVPGASHAGRRLGRRRLRDRSRVARREGLSPAGPAHRRGRAPAAPAVHRLGQAHRRLGTRSRCGLLRPRLDHTSGSPQQQGLRVRPCRSRLERCHRRASRRCSHRRGPAHVACPRARSGPYVLVGHSFGGLYVHSSRPNFQIRSPG